MTKHAHKKPPEPIKEKKQKAEEYQKKQKKRAMLSGKNPNSTTLKYL